MCIPTINLILDVHLLYLIMNFVIIIEFNSFVCIKTIAENPMTNINMGLQNIQILRCLFVLCYSRIWQYN